MILHQLQGPPSPDLARALAEFESCFTYPLGPGRSFRICHGDDYPRFFRAIGEAACFVARRQERVVGTLGIAVRRLLLPEGSECLAAYVGDLKIVPEARGGMALLRLARAGEAWASPKVRAAYSVVMDGTPRTPTAYTGRAGIPAFQELGKVVVWRISTHPAVVDSDARFVTTSERGSACYRELSKGRYACPAGTPTERSESPPTWLVHPDGSACGLLEDTRRAKRLLADDGSEMRSAHLSCFAFRTPEAGAELFRVALRGAAALGFPALFVAVVPQDATSLAESLGESERVAAPATIYGAGLQAGPAWNINSSEI